MKIVKYLLSCIVDGIDYAFGNGRGDVKKGLIAAAMLFIYAGMFAFFLFFLSKTKLKPKLVRPFAFLIPVVIFIIICIILIIVEYLMNL